MNEMSKQEETKRHHQAKELFNRINNIMKNLPKRNRKNAK